MEIVIDTGAPEPPFEQLITQIKKAVADGELDPGDSLPSIRQLAADLDLNSKTVAKAYRLLERDSVLQARGYRGTFVHPDGRDAATVDLNAKVLSQFVESISAFRAAGITDPEIRAAFTKAMGTVASP